MDPIRNPYQPGAGCRPPELVGRDPVIDEAKTLLGRIKAGRAEKSMLLAGLRGVGKTVLLNELQSLAIRNDYLTASVEAHEGKPMTTTLAPLIRKLLIDLSTRKKVGEKIKAAWGVFASFVNSFEIKINETTYALKIKAIQGKADSGDIELDLPELFCALGEAAQDAGTPVALFIDEIQYFENNELSSLIMAMHKVQQFMLPIVLFGAGLPILPTMAGESKSYAERLFNFPVIDALTEKESEKAIRDPARPHRVVYKDEAIQEIYAKTKGYPYFIQEWGYHCWLRGYEGKPINIDVVKEATAEAIARLDNNFFKIRFDRCTKNEKEYLLEIAKLGEGPQNSGDIARAKGVKIQSLMPVRAKLIKKGIIYCPFHAHIDFTVPLFGEFIKRAMTVPGKKKGNLFE